MAGCRLRAAHGVALLWLCACPQLLDDDFDVLTPEGALPGETGGAAGAGPLGPPDSGLSGSGGAPGRAGTGATSDAGPHDASAPADAAEPDATAGQDEVLVALRASLVHRYRFSAGATLKDSVGTADVVSSVGVTFLNGAAVFAGTGQYLDLPNDVLAGITNCTIEAWVVWTPDDINASSASWQRIFDFGSNSAVAEGAQGSDANAIYLSPRSGGPAGKLHLQYESGGSINIDAPAPLPAQVLAHVVAVVDDTSNILSIYLDGSLQGALAFPGSLTTINYRNNWLGRSQYEGDPTFDGRILDFRIHSAVLTPALIQASHALGPDVEP